MFLGSSFGSFSESDLRPLVYLMTYYSSKGLDFKNVFLPGLNEGERLVPKKKMDNDVDAERRLLFVAITRSRENLFLSHSSDRPHSLISNLPNSAITKVFPKLETEADKDDFF